MLEFFAIYINDLISILKKLGVGCHMIQFSIACFLFADDMTLLSPTHYALQQLLDVCAEYCMKFCLKFKTSKTKVMVFGKLSRSVQLLAKLQINGKGIRDS